MNTANTPKPAAQSAQVADGEDNRAAGHHGRPPAPADALMELAAGDDPHLGLVAVRALGDIADALEAHQVSQARQAAMTWAEIGRLLGVSAQAAHQKHATPRR